MNCLSKKGVLIGASLLMVFSSAGCSLYPKDDDSLQAVLLEPVKMESKEYKVKKGDISQVISVGGVFSPVSQNDFSFQAKGGVLKGLLVKEGDKVKNGQLLAELDNDNLTNQVKMQEINLQKAQIRYDAAVKEKANEASVKDAELDVQVEQIQLDELKNELSKVNLYSNMEGTVSKCTDIAIGDQISVKQTIVSIVNDSKMYLECTDEKIKNFKNGLKVKVIFMDKEYTGEVVAMEMDKKAAETTPNSGSTTVTSEVKYKAMKVNLDQMPAGVSLGQNATVVLEVGKKQNVVIIPKRHAKITDKKATIIVKENGKDVEKIVEIGLVGEENIEIISGLKEGDSIVEK